MATVANLFSRCMGVFAIKLRKGGSGLQVSMIFQHHLQTQEIEKYTSCEGLYEQRLCFA